MRLLSALLLSLFIGASAHADTPTNTPTTTPTATPTATRTASPTITPSPTAGAIVAYYAGDSAGQLNNYLGSVALTLTTTGGAITNPSSPVPAQGDRSLGTGFAGLNSYFRAPNSVLTANGSIAFYYYAYSQVAQPSVETVLEAKGVSVANNFVVTYNYTQRTIRVYYNGAPGGAAIYVDSALLTLNAWNKVLINHNESGVAIKIGNGSFNTNTTKWNYGTLSQVNIGGSATYFPMTSTNIIDAVMFSTQINEGFPPTYPTPSATPSRTVTPTFTITKTFTSSPTASPTFSSSPTSSATPTISSTSTPSPTRTATPTITTTRTPTATRTASPTPTSTPVPNQSYGSLSIVSEGIPFTYPNNGVGIDVRFSRKIVQIVNFYIVNFTSSDYPNYANNSVIVDPTSYTDAVNKATADVIVSWDTNRNVKITDNGSSLSTPGDSCLLIVQYLTAP